MNLCRSFLHLLPCLISTVRVNQESYLKFLLDFSWKALILCPLHNSLSFKNPLVSGYLGSPCVCVYMQVNIYVYVSDNSSIRVSLRNWQGRLS